MILSPYNFTTVSHKIKKNNDTNHRKLWNFWNLALMTSEAVGILRSLWVVWLETRGIEDSAEDFVLETLVALDVGMLG
jgi:hypothetical protein